MKTVALPGGGAVQAPSQIIELSKQSFSNERIYSLKHVLQHVGEMMLFLKINTYTIMQCLEHVET